MISWHSQEYRDNGLKTGKLARQIVQHRIAEKLKIAKYRPSESAGDGITGTSRFACSDIVSI